MSGSPFLSVPGAVEATGLDAGVAAHYGSPNVEQRRLEDGSAVVDLSQRGIVSVTGPDRLSWLNSISSQKLDRLAPGEASETLILDPQGHIEYSARIVDDGVTAWLLADRAEADGLFTWLDRMRFTLRVEVARRDDDFVTVGTMARDFASIGLEAAAPNGVALVWHDPWTHVTIGGWQYSAEHPAADWAWSEVLVTRDTFEALAGRAVAGDLTVAGSLSAEALRIAAWRPRLATEVDERSIPHELDWLRSAVHLDKGCYRGQETVAKVHNLGHPPRRIVMLHLDGSDTVLPQHGDEVLAERTRPEAEAGWQVCGEVTSAAIHHELGPIALAVIRRGVPVEAPLRVRASESGELVAAAQVVIVPPEAGATAGIQRMPRLGVRP